MGISGERCDSWYAGGASYGTHRAQAISGKHRPSSLCHSLTPSSRRTDCTRRRLLSALLPLRPWAAWRGAHGARASIRHLCSERRRMRGSGTARGLCHSVHSGLAPIRDPARDHTQTSVERRTWLQEALVHLFTIACWVAIPREGHRRPGNARCGPGGWVNTQAWLGLEELREDCCRPSGVREPRVAARLLTPIQDRNLRRSAREADGR
jgi:hypothetical protein